MIARHRLWSSDEVLNAFLRGGFVPHRRARGSHQELVRLRTDGRHDYVTIILGLKEIPRGTFRNYLKQANVTYDEFLDWAKVKRKKRR